MAQSPARDGTDAADRIEKPVPPPMQSVIKGGWTYRVENPIETSVSALRELAEAIRELAQQIRTDSWAFVRYGPKMLSSSETHARQQQILALAAEVEKLAAEVPHHSLPFARVTEILQRLHKLGFFPNGLLLKNVTRAFVSAEKFRRLEQNASDVGEEHG
jgi:hypothetical protein